MDSNTFPQKQQAKPLNSFVAPKPQNLSNNHRKRKSRKPSASTPNNPQKRPFNDGSSGTQQKQQSQNPNQKQQKPSQQQNGAKKPRMNGPPPTNNGQYRHPLPSQHPQQQFQPRPHFNNYQNGWNNATYFPRAHNPSMVAPKAHKEMLYQNGRLPTGQFVRNTSAESDDDGTDEAATTAMEEVQSIARDSFLLKRINPNASAAVPFLKVNPAEKSASKESSTSSTLNIRTPTTPAMPDEPSTSMDAPSPIVSDAPAPIVKEEKERIYSAEEMEEIRRAFNATTTGIKQEVDHDEPPASPMGHQFEAVEEEERNELPANDHGFDFASDNFSDLHQFSPAPNHIEFHVPDPSGDSQALLHQWETSMANLESQEAQLKQRMRSLHSELARVMTEIDIVGTEKSNLIYKYRVLLRNQK